MVLKVLEMLLTSSIFCLFSGVMARGQQKLQSQAKAAEKAAKQKKQQGHNANDQKKAAQQALVFSCSVCKVSYLSSNLIFFCSFLLEILRFDSFNMSNL
jgi:hypothetical protein